MTAHEGRWRDHCPACGVDDYHLVDVEGHRRMTIRCQDCGHGWNLCTPGSEYRTGYRSFNAVEFDVAPHVAAYKAGATLAALARRQDVAADTMRRRLIEAGVVMRDRRASLVPGGGCVERAAATRARAVALYRAGCCNARVAAARMGVSEMTIRRAWRRGGVE